MNKRYRIDELLSPLGMNNKPNPNDIARDIKTIQDKKEELTDKLTAAGIPISGMTNETIIINSNMLSILAEDIANKKR